MATVMAFGFNNLNSNRANGANRIKPMIFNWADEVIPNDVTIFTLALYIQNQRKNIKDYKVVTILEKDAMMEEEIKQFTRILYNKYTEKLETRNIVSNDTNLLSKKERDDIIKGVKENDNENYNNIFTIDYSRISDKYDIHYLNGYKICGKKYIKEYKESIDATDINNKSFFFHYSSYLYYLELLFTKKKRKLHHLH